MTGLRNGKKIRDKWVRIFGGFYATGRKIESDQNHQICKDGHVTAEEGTFVSMTENLGRTLLLVELKAGNTSTCLSMRSN
jgi:hypothetical protein